jgi:hypothetical protein
MLGSKKWLRRIGLLGMAVVVPALSVFMATRSVSGFGGGNNFCEYSIVAQVQRLPDGTFTTVTGNLGTACVPCVGSVSPDGVTCTNYCVIYIPEGDYRLAGIKLSDCGSCSWNDDFPNDVWFVGIG